MTTRLDGKATAEAIVHELETQLAQHSGRAPGLAVVLVGNNPASHAYVKTKKTMCARVGIQSFDYQLPDTVSQADLEALIHELNGNDHVDGILVQLPLPDHIDEAMVINTISPTKDVDGFHPYNVGQLLIGTPAFRPCTPYGVIKLLEHYGIDTAGKHAVVVGRSNIVGKPMAALLVQSSAYGNCTVTIAHSRTQDLPALVRQADIVVAAIGKAHFITADMVKPGAVVIDVGINSIPDATTPKGYRLVGDVDTDAVAPIASAITPVPGGVGPMTVAMLMHNTIDAFKQRESTSRSAVLEQACARFKPIVSKQLDRVETLLKTSAAVDYSAQKTITIGVCYGDGIGPEICQQAQRFLEHSLRSAVQSGRIQFSIIDGLTIENRAAHKQAIPDSVLAQLKACDVILKGPTTTPQKGDQWPNIESANVAMRRELDLYACVRPIRVPSLGIDWVLYRENTEGSYMLGSHGFHVDPTVGIDFTVTTRPGSERLIRAAFEHAKTNGRSRVTIVTKSNIVKTTDGLFSAIAKEIAADYPTIECDEWYIDIMTANLINPATQSKFEVLAMPNLYGDILSDEAAQIQGGVGTAGSANIGDRWAMFEAVHGSAPRMIEENRAQYADPSSMIKAAQLLLSHIGYPKEAKQLEQAMTVCSLEKALNLTGHADGCTGAQWADYIMETYDDPQLSTRYDTCLRALTPSHS